MYAEWVRPECVVVLWVAHGNVSRDAECVVLTCPVAECAGHVLELPGALLVEGWKGRDRCDLWAGG